jgi:ubiquinone/menaquinone biosynthesis C-methylase UbiE
MPRRDNRDLYQRRDVVKRYARDPDLLRAEQAILARIEPRLRDARMLDVGVGAGRTTVHFAPLVREYVGVDYSETMIAACNTRFPPGTFASDVSFAVCDVRAMEIFPDASFDFVLFSFNGLDDVQTHEDRLAALGEMARVCRPGGALWFSSHNLNSAARMLSFSRAARDIFGDFEYQHRSLNPLVVGKRLVKPIVLRASNESPKELSNASWALVAEGLDRSGRVRRYWVRPPEAVRQAHESGFARVRVFRANGDEVTGEGDVARMTDEWVNYVCTRSSAIETGAS